MALPCPPSQSCQILLIIIVSIVFSIIQFIFMTLCANFGKNWIEAKDKTIGIIFTAIHGVFLIVVCAVMVVNLFLFVRRGVPPKLAFVALMVVIPGAQLAVCLFFVWESVIVYYGNSPMVSKEHTNATLYSSKVALFGIVIHVLFFCFNDWGWNVLWSKYQASYGTPKPVTPDDDA